MTTMMLRTPYVNRKLFNRGLTDWVDDFFRDDRLLPKFMWDERSLIPRRGDECGFCPSVDTYVKDNVLHVRAELPGVELKDVDVSLDGTLLTISGERKTSHVEEGTSYESREMTYGSFCRSFSVPQGIDPDKIHAGYEDGILTVTVPLPEAMEEKHIPIEVKKVALEAKTDETTTA